MLQCLPKAWNADLMPMPSLILTFQSSDPPPAAYERILQNVGSRVRVGAILFFRYAFH